MTFRLLITTVSALLLPGLLAAQTKNAYPMLMSLQPTAAQIGTQTEHELHARYNLAGATSIMVSGEGVQAESIPNEKDKPDAAERNDVTDSRCKLRMTVAADAQVGVRDFRVMTPHGVSTLGQVVLVRDPVVAEVKGNDTVATAQEINWPIAVCGAIEKAEDVDYFKFHVEAGTSLVFHVHAQRLLNRLHDMQTRIDPLITVRTEAGSVLAASDNFYAGDPLLQVTFEHAGNYILEVRDVRYLGNADWAYVVEMHDRPFVTQASPLVVEAGKQTTIGLNGYQLPVHATATVTGDAAKEIGLQSMAVQVSERWTNDIPIYVSELPVIYETEVQPVTGENEAPEAKPLPPVIAFPATIAGTIGTPGEIDRYAFEAKGKERWTFQVIARRARSQLDPILRIVSEKGNAVGENDDGSFHRVVSADSLLENWTVPADGRYTLEIRDLHQGGGASFPYAIRVSRADPHFLLEADTDKSLLAPGMHTVVYVKAVRKNGFAGEIQLHAKGLPEGVEAIAGRILADGNDGCVMLHAKEGAALGAANIEIYGTSTFAEGDQAPVELRGEAKPFQEYYSPGGGRGSFPVDAHTVSIAKPMDLRSIRVNTQEVVLKQGGSQKIEIEIERAPDYAGNVTLDVMLQHLERPFGMPLPKGVTVDIGASKTLLTKEETKGYITLKAAADAPPVVKQLVAVNAHVSINFVMKHTLCAPPLYVSVEK